MTTTQTLSQPKVVPQNTTMATWAGAIARAVGDMGGDARALFASAGIDYSLANRPDRRIPVTDMTRLWELAVKTSGDPAFGLRVAQQVNLTTFHALGVAAMASETVSDAANMISRFASMVSDGIDMQVRIGDAEVGLVLGMRPGYPRFADACVEAVLASIVLTGRQLAPSLRLARVAFRHRCVADPLRYRQLFDCPVSFAAAEDGLFGSPDLLSSGPLPASSPSVAQANAALCEEYLSSRESGETSSRVRDLIARQLRAGAVPLLPDTAAALAMSERKLQRLLREEGVQFRDLLDQVRALIARQLLVDDGLAVGRVAEQLGFDSLSAFSRAFRRWYDMSPRDMRQSGRKGA